MLRYKLYLSTVGIIFILSSNQVLSGFASRGENALYSFRNDIFKRVISQNGTNDFNIQNSSCKTDVDCKSEPSPSDDDNNILENYMCVNNKCTVVVADGQQCSAQTECAAYHYSVINNLNLTSSDICTNCAEPICNSAWDSKYKAPVNQSYSNMCCKGLKMNDNCTLVATNVDPCGHGLACIDNQCVDKNVKSKTLQFVGVIISLIGSTILNVGLNVQKFAFTRHQNTIDQDKEHEIIEQKKKERESMISLEIVGGERTNSNLSSMNASHIEQSGLYKRLEKFMFWKQIVVSPLWVVGFMIYLFGTMMGFVALQFAPQSLIAPLGAISLITNLLIAPILHSQKLTSFDIIGVLIIIGGSVVITIFSGTTGQDFRLCVLIALFQRPATIIYLSVISCFIASLFAFIKLVEKRIATKVASTTEVLTNDVTINYSQINSLSDNMITNNSRANSRTNSLSANSPDNNNSNSLEACDGQDMTNGDIRLNIESSHQTYINKDVNLAKEKSDNINIIEISSLQRRDSVKSKCESVLKGKGIMERIMLPIAYAVLASSMATITTLFAKSLINLMVQSIFKHDNQFDRILSWIILMVTLITAFGQVYWLNIGLKKYDALVQVPIFFCNWSVFDIIGGGVYYDEFKNFEPYQYIGFIGGVLLIFSGVALLSKRLASLTKEEEELYERQRKLEQKLKKHGKNKNK